MLPLEGEEMVRDFQLATTSVVILFVKGSAAALNDGGQMLTSPISGYFVLYVYKLLLSLAVLLFQFHSAFLLCIRCSQNTQNRLKNQRLYSTIWLEAQSIEWMRLLGLR